MIQNDNENVGEVLAPPVINLAAAIQILSAVTANIGCIAGASTAYDALRSVMAGRAELETLIGAMRKLTPSDLYPPPGPEFDALVERILCRVSAHGTQGWNMTDFHVRDVLNALAEEGRADEEG